MKITHKDYHFTAIIERDEDGYHAYCPDLRGCHTQGDTYEEAFENVKDAIKLYVDDMIECGEEVPQHETVSITHVVVTT